jgi:hypothetical protein
MKEEAMGQSIWRKLRVWLHCLFRLHRRGVVHHANQGKTEGWTIWVCETCAAHVLCRLRHTGLTNKDIQWATKSVAKDLGRNES